MTALAVRWKPTRPLADPQLVLLPGLSVANLGLAGKTALVGVAMFAIAFGTASLLGGIHVTWAGVAPVAVAGTVGSILLTTILNAAWEEYAFRGWAFSACVARFGPHPVALGIGTIFGLLHLLNPNVTWVAVVSVAAAGWLIGYVMLASGNIIAAIGIHVGWNITQSLLTTDRLWIVERGLSPLVSGGAYGLEASVPGLVITLVAAGVAAAVFVRCRGRSA
jgi:membrane protease YdiL (CAAX protease family)